MKTFNQFLDSCMEQTNPPTKRNDESAPGAIAPYTKRSNPTGSKLHVNKTFGGGNGLVAPIAPIDPTPFKAAENAARRAFSKSNLNRFSGIGRV